MIRILTGLLWGSLGGTWSLSLTWAQEEGNEEEKPAEYVGSEACLACHDQTGKTWLQLGHSRTLQRSERPPDQRGCEACHGPGSRHGETAQPHPAIVHPDKLSPAESVQVCLRCHQDRVRANLWRRSEHGRSKLRCHQCHLPHQATKDPPMLGQAVVELCLKCHPAERADFGQVSHHPVLEEHLHCAACHNPMGAGGEKMIQVRREQAVVSPSGKEVDDLCLSCHAEKGGPFLYEHDPLSGGLSEGCLTCHLPHGAPHDQLLRADVRGLCLRCHSDIATHPQFSFMTGNCLRCHTRIHGSNTDPRLLR